MTIAPQLDGLVAALPRLGHIFVGLELVPFFMMGTLLQDMFARCLGKWMPFQKQEVLQELCLASPPNQHRDHNHPQETHD